MKYTKNEDICLLITTITGTDELKPWKQRGIISLSPVFNICCRWSMKAVA